MINLMVLHWGTVTQIIDVHKDAAEASFKVKPKLGVFTCGLDLDTIPRYNIEVQQRKLN